MNLRILLVILRGGLQEWFSVVDNITHLGERNKHSIALESGGLITKPKY
jgi:hypothetical protein